MYQEQRSTIQAEHTAQHERRTKVVAIPRVQQISPTDEIIGSAHTMQGYRESQRILQEDAAEIDSARIHGAHIRGFLTLASSNVTMAQNLQYGLLRHLAQLPEAADPVWAGIAYHESPRSLSMDAMMWTHWEPATCPWTTWKASWVDRTTHPAPPMNFKVKKSKISWKDRLLQLYRPKAGYKSKRIKKVTSIQPPTIQKTGAGGSRFVEHVPKPPQNLGTRPDYPPDNLVQKLGRQLASQRHQNSVVITARGEGIKNKMAVDINGKDLAASSKEEKDVVCGKPMRKRDIVKELFCFGFMRFGPMEPEEHSEDTKQLVEEMGEAT